MPAAAVKRLDKMSKMPMSMVAHVMSDASPSPGEAVAAVRTMEVYCCLFS
jgi:hypothetical protein